MFGLLDSEAYLAFTTEALYVCLLQLICSGQNVFNENETIAKYEIMDGAPVRGKYSVCELRLNFNLWLGIIYPRHTLQKPGP